MKTTVIISALSLLATTMIQQLGFLQNRILWRRWLAAAILSVPALLLSWKEWSDVGLIPKEVIPTLLISVSMSMVVILFTSIFASKPENLLKYPELKVSSWSASLFLQSSAAWVVYDISYEFLFRGYLFLNLLKDMGMGGAIALTVTMYSVVHIPKGLKEALLCIPFGILLCGVTLLTENIWSAVIIHLTLSVSNEYFAAHEKYGFQFIRNRSSYLNNSKSLQQES